MSSPRRRSRKANDAAAAATTTASSEMKSPSKRAKSPMKTQDEPSRKAPKTPPKQKESSVVDKNAKFVTPSISSVVAEEKESVKQQVVAATKSKVRRSLDMDERAPRTDNDDQMQKKADATQLKTYPFGNKSNSINVPSNVRRVYEIISKHTGSIGGNGHGGAIYGELTVGSMQKMTNLMIEYTNLSKDSRFIDVGCGLGKPNLHVAQYPGVEFSYGIEMEQVRWMLGMANFDQVLKAAQNNF